MQRCCFGVFLRAASKDVFSPTVTVVTGDATIVLTAIENDYEQSMRQHDLWYDCLKKKLNFGNFHYHLHSLLLLGSLAIALQVIIQRLLCHCFLQIVDYITAFYNNNNNINNRISTASYGRNFRGAGGRSDQCPVNVLD